MTIRPAIEPGGGEWNDLELTVGYDVPPLIPPGEYDARASSGRARPSYGGRYRLHLSFEILGGDYDGKTIAYWCTLPERKGQRWKDVSPASRFFRAWCVANGAPPLRRDRIGLEVFKNRLFRIRVRVVEKDRAGAALPLVNRYSVVDMLLERLA